MGGWQTLPSSHRACMIEPRATHQSHREGNEMHNHRTTQPAPMPTPAPIRPRVFTGSAGI